MCYLIMKKGDVPGARIFILIGVVLIGMLFLSTVFARTLTPSLKTSDEARASYFAHTLASYISALSGVDQGYIERDFEGIVDVEVKKYTWVGTITHFRRRPSVYHLKVTVYRTGDKREKKSFIGADITDIEKRCEEYCTRQNCECEQCSHSGECTVVDLKKSETSEAVPFIGFVHMAPGQDSIEISQARYISLQKDPSEDAVKILKAEEVSFCTEPGLTELRNVIDSYTNKYGVDKNTARAVITAENGFRHCKAEGEIDCSLAGACGIMQLLPSTANWIAQKYGENIDYKNPIDNIKAGVMYLNYTRGRMENYTQGEDLEKVMVANYNCEDIFELVKNNCSKGEPGCWDSVEKYINSADPGTENKYCQGGGGDETYNYVRRIFNEFKPCFERNPDCYYACFFSTCKKRGWEVVAG